MIQTTVTREGRLTVLMDFSIVVCARIDPLAQLPEGEPRGSASAYRLQLDQTA
ncbi:hypothetical protein [Paraburkholderia elongata]|uniref:Uncharacterized protein n=1 Tax=Paraburkholderia elongata TaxID=2675747 RepID=A0A972NZV9_9BURK|nr:hypothetical protein [Paraburkholderia elongata]NPT60827.1 hypothetical protein [Paraburkholderia elongata]